MYVQVCYDLIMAQNHVHKEELVLSFSYTDLSNYAVKPWALAPESEGAFLSTVGEAPLS